MAHLGERGVWGISGGANGTRTRNPLLAKQVRYQLRHGPSGRMLTGSVSC